MGKSNYKKIKNLASNTHEKKILKSCYQTQIEINKLIEDLLKLTSETSNNASEEWELHLEIDKLLQRIQELENVFNISKRREEHFQPLFAWVKENGGIIGSISVNMFDKMEYGLEAANDLEKGDLICEIPRKLMMTSEYVKNTTLSYLLKKDPILKNMGNVALALLLILEYLKQEKSFWYPYIASLPTKYNTVLYFTIEDFLELKGSPTFEPAVKHCKNIARQYAYFKKLFLTSNDEASSVLKNKFSYQLYRWAVSTVMTRQNFIPSKEGDAIINSLIPLWDMCNHMNGELSTEFKAEKSQCTVWKPFRKGEQVLIFYGKRSNADFFLHNGFVYGENEHESYRLRLGISKADKLYQSKCEVLKRLRIGFENSDFYLHSGPEHVKEELLAFLRVFNMDAEHLEYWKSSDHVKDLTMKNCDLDERIESKVWNFLQVRIKLLLSTYKQNTENDESTTSECRHLIRTQLSLEKKFLNSVLKYIQQRIKT